MGHKSMERQDFASFDGVLSDEVRDARKIAPAIFGNLLQSAANIPWQSAESLGIHRRTSVDDRAHLLLDETMQLLEYLAPFFYSCVFG